MGSARALWSSAAGRWEKSQCTRESIPPCRLPAAGLSQLGELSVLRRGTVGICPPHVSVPARRVWGRELPLLCRVGMMLSCRDGVGTG